MGKNIKIKSPEARAAFPFVVTDYQSPALQRFVTRGGVIIPLSHSRSLRKVAALSALFFFFVFSILPQALMAAPVIENIQGDGTLNQEVEGNVTNITVAGNLTATTTNADQLASEIWNIHFANHSDSLILNVFDSTGTQLMGTINIHNGLFALLNSAGVEIAQSAAINLFDAGFIASALGSINANLDTGKYVFQSEDGQNGFVLNNGRITGTEGSFAAMLGRAVENAGQIEMPMGKVALAGGEQVTLSLTGNNDFISVVVDEAVSSPVLKNGLAVQNQIEMGGTLEAHQVMMDAKAVNDVFDNSVNITGHVKANTAVENQDGSIDIVASDDIHIREEAMIQALSGTVEIESTDGEIEFATDLTAETAMLTADKVKFTGMNAQTLSGDITITNLEITTPGKTVYFAPDTHLTLLGNTHIEGEGGYAAGYIRFFSSIKDSPWYINIASPDYHIAYIGIRDSQNLGEELITAYPKADYGGNTGWKHNDTVVDWTTLDLVRNNLSGSYVLGASLSSADLDYAGIGDDFDPIGGWNGQGDFTGTFDGQGYTISDLIINKPSDFYVGLFGRTAGADIQNVGLVGVNITGGSFTGSLVGSTSTSTIISSISATGNVFGDSNVGGLVGANNSSTISLSYATVDVDANGSAAGGLVGNNSTATISSSYATGDVSAGGSNAGGLAGSVGQGGTITESYATGTVHADVNYAGGLIGYVTNNPTITSSFSTGVATSGGANVGGLIGAYFSGTLTNNWWHNDTNSAGIGNTSSANVTKADAGSDFFNSSHAVYTGATSWDFTVDGLGAGSGDWIMAGLPHLQDEWSASITNVYQLQMMALNLDANYTLANNIDASATASWNGGLGFDPVGYSTGESYQDPTNPFTGGFDGNSYSIMGLTINRSTENFVGLFGAARYGVVIRDIGLIGGSIEGGTNVGALVGAGRNSIAIIDSYSTASVSGDNRVGGLIGKCEYCGSVSGSFFSGSVDGSFYVGGLIGELSYSTSILNSYSYGDVVATGSYVGGLAGAIYSTDVTSSYSFADVTGHQYVGGLAGSNVGSDAVISNSYAVGAVSGEYEAGGLVGTMDQSVVLNSYASGDVSGSFNQGGLVGTLLNGGTISNSYAEGNVSGGSYAGGLVGQASSSSITGSYAVGAVSGGSDVGGLVGLDNYGSSVISNSYFTDGDHVNGLGNFEAGGESAFYGDGHAVYSDWTFGDGSGEWDGFTNGLPHLDYEWSTNVTTLLQLQNMHLDLNAYYYLQNDIDASVTQYWNWDSDSSSYLGFKPIGRDGYEFNGFFGGADYGDLESPMYTIQGLYINRPNDDQVGLFGKIGFDGATAWFRLTDVNITGNDYVGAVAGEFNGTNNSPGFYGVYSSGTVVGNATVGGLIGYNAGIVSYSASDGFVSGNINVGGLVGYNTNYIDSSRSGATVEAGDSNVGGLVGANGSGGTIYFSYATGDVNGGGSFIGGLVGANYADIFESFATGVATGSSSGGLTGLNVGSVTNGWWYNDTNESGHGSASSVGITKASALSDFYGTGSGTGGAVYGSWNFYDADMNPSGPWESFSNALPRLAWENFIAPPITGITISGLLSWWNDMTAGTTGINMGLSIDGAAPITPVEIGADGSFSFSTVEITDGQSLLLYIDDATYQANFFGVVQNSPTEITGLDFEFGKLTLGSSSIAALGADIAASALPDMSGIADNILYTTNLTTVTALAEMVVNAGFSGALDMNGQLLNLQADLAGDVTLSGSGTIQSNGSEFVNLSVGGDYIFDDATVISGNFDLTSGTVSQLGDFAVTGNYTQTGGTFSDLDPESRSFSVGGSFSIPTTAGAFNRFGYQDGEGYYLIRDVYDLQAVEGYLSNNFKLANDVDASSTSGWNSNAGFNPIGDASNAFTGIFDGQGYTISGLRMNRTNLNYAGLFARSNGATFQDLNLTGIDYDIDNQTINAYAYLGGLVGYATNTIIESVTTAGDLYVWAEGAGGNIQASGGLVGYIINSTVNDSGSAADVTMPGGDSDQYSYLGGLIGWMAGSTTVLRSYATGAVYNRAYDAQLKTGGFVGYANGSNNLIEKSYSTGSVTSWVPDAGAVFEESRVGGFIGQGHGITIRDSYASGNVNSPTQWQGSGNFYTGGFAGYLASDAVVERSYSSGTVTAGGNYVYAGGFVGINYGTIRDSFTAADVTASGSITGIGGFAAAHSGTIINSYYVDSAYSNGLGTLASGADITARINSLKSPNHAVYNREGYEWSFTDGSGEWDAYSDVLPRLQWENYGTPLQGFLISGDLVGFSGDYDVLISVNGNYMRTFTSSGGSFNFSLFEINDDDRFMIYVDSATEQGSLVGIVSNNTVNISDLLVTNGSLTLGSASGNAGVDFTNADLAAAATDFSTQAVNDYTPFSVAGSDLTVDENFDLTVSASVNFASGGNVTVGADFINAGVTDIRGNDLSVSGNFENTGTLRLNGDETVSLAMDTDSGTIDYAGSGSYSGLLLGNTYNHLTFSGSGSYALDGDLTAGGNLTVTGNLDADGNNLNVAGNWSVTGAASNLGLVTLTGSGKTITSTGNHFEDLTIAGSYTLADALLVDETLLVQSGSLATGTQAVTVTGNADFRGGTFSSTSGTKTFNSGITVSGGTVSVGGATFDINGDAVLSSGTVNGNTGTLNVAGRWLRTGATYSAGTSNVIFDGTGLQTVLGGDFYRLTNQTAGTLQFGSAPTISNNLTQTSGILDFNGYGMTVSGTATMNGGTLTALAGNNSFGTLTLNNAVSMNAGSANLTVGSLNLNGTSALTAPGTGKTFNLSGNFAKASGATFTANGGTLTLTGGSQSISGNNTFYNLTKSSSSSPTLTFEAGSTQTIQGALTLSGSAGHEMNLRSSSSSLVDAERVWNLDLQGSASATYLNVKDSNNIGTAISAVNSTDGGHNSGWSFLATQLFTWLGVTTDWFNPANWNLGSAPNAVNADILILATANQPTLSGSVTVNNLTLENGTTLTISGHDLTVGGTLSNNGTVRLQGNEAVTLANGNDTNSGSWQYLGDGTNGVITVKDFGTNDYYNLTLNSASGNAFVVGAALRANGAFTISGASSFTSNANNINAGSTEVSSGAFNAGSGTHSLGALNVSNGASFNAQTSNLTTSGIALSGAGTTFTAGAQSIDVNGSVTIGANTVFTAPSATMTVSGNFTNNGTFNHNSGSVVLDGSSQSIFGETTFNNLSKQTANGTLAFDAGKTQTILGALTLLGTNGNLMTLQKSGSGSQWSINAQGGVNVGFVRIQDSNAVTALSASSSIDLGGNTGWSFGANLLTWLGINTNWLDIANWDLGYVPDEIDSVIIANTANDPLLTQALTLNNLTIQSGGVLGLNGQNLTVNGIFSNEGTVQLIGTEAAINLANGNDVNSGAWEYLGNGLGTTITIKDFGTGTDYYNLILNSTSGAKNAFTLGANLNVAGTLTMSGMTEFDSNGKTVTAVSGVLTDGTYRSSTATQTFTNFSVSGNGTLELNSGQLSISGNIDLGTGATVNINGGNVNVTGNLSVADGVVMNAGGAGTMTVSGSLTQTGGTFIAPTLLQIAGNWITTAGSTFDANGGTVTFTGSGNHTVVSNGQIFHNLSQTGSGTLQLADAMTVANSLSIGTGATVDLNGRDLTATGATFSNNGTLQLQGAEILTGFSNDTDSGTVRYVGSGTYNDLAAGDNYYNLTIQGTGTYNPNAAMDINGTFSQSAGTFTAPVMMNVGGNLNIGDSANFVHNNGLVVLDGAVTSVVDAPNGELVFWDFSILADNKIVQFRAGDRFTVLSPNTWIAQGTNLVLTSTNPGTHWEIDVADTVGGVNLDGFTVSWSNNVSGADISCPTCFDGGNNINWVDLKSLGGGVDEPPVVELLCPGPDCPDGTVVKEGDEVPASLNDLIDVSIEDECSADADAALKNPACREKSKSKVSVHEGSVWLYCPDAAGNEQICGVMEAGGKVEIEWLATPQQLQVMSAEERIVSHQLYEEMRRKAPEIAQSSNSLPVANIAVVDSKLEMNAASKRFATLSKFQGEVLIKRAGSMEWTPGYEGMILGEKDEIKTGRATKVEVHLDHDAETGKFYLYENSLLRLATLDRDAVSKDKTTVLDLAMGRVITRAEKLQGESKFNIRTPTVVAGVRGTVFEVSVDGDADIQFA